jgi:hypothetical protein
MRFVTPATSVATASNRTTAESRSPRAGARRRMSHVCAYCESAVVLAAIGFGLGVGRLGIVHLVRGSVSAGLVLLSFAALPFLVWGLLRYVLRGTS